GGAQDLRINATAVQSDLQQLRALGDDLGWTKAGEPVPEAVRTAWLAHILALPGVVPEPGNIAFHPDEEWPLVERVLEEALGRLQAMRQEEGRAMAEELLQYPDHIAAPLVRSRERIPSVVITYRDRLHERVRNLLTELDVEIDRSDLIKEVSVFAERSDIAEEVVRLASHLEQFQEIMNEPESPGRKLEFL